MLQESIPSSHTASSSRSVLTSSVERPKNFLCSFLEMLPTKTSIKTKYRSITDKKIYIAKSMPNLTPDLNFTSQTAKHVPKRHLLTPSSRPPILFASLQPITPRPEYQTPSVIHHLARLERQRINKLQRQKAGNARSITPPLPAKFGVRKEVWDGVEHYGPGIDAGDDDDDEDGFLWLTTMISRGKFTTGSGKEKLKVSE